MMGVGSVATAQPVVTGANMADEKKETKRAHAGHGYTHTHIEHHDDGSHTVEHHHSEGAHKNKKYAVASLDHVHDGMQDHLGEMNPGEAEAEAGQGGIEEGMGGEENG